MVITRRSLGLAIQLSLASVFVSPATWAQTEHKDETQLPTVVVSATGVSEDAKIAAPHSLIDGEAILKKGEGNLGDVLNGLPGVHSDTFGAGAGRPIIRGQTVPRVKVVNDSSSLLDASDISPDHAVTADPLLLQRVEVLRGPATLLFGSGAVGGVVNLLDNKIPTELPFDGIEGRVAIRANTVANERAGAAWLTHTLGSNVALHGEFSRRDADDYRVPGLDERRIDGSWVRSDNASVGLSWIGEDGYIGMAYSTRKDKYGLPGHNHEFEGCHAHGSTLHCGPHDHDDDDEHEHDDEHGDTPSVDLSSKRFDLRAELRQPFDGLRRIRFRASHTDYHHDEIDEGEVGTSFDNKGHEERVEFEHEPLGNWVGVFGVQHSDATFRTEGAEAFLPTVDTRSTGIFLVEHVDVSEHWHLELGARHEWLKHETSNDPRNRPTYDKSASSFAGALSWSLTPDYTLALSAARSKRLPHPQELYARGIHLATNTYECGMLPNAWTCGGEANDAEVTTETSRNTELSLKKVSGPLTFEISAYDNQVSDYVYAQTLDRVENFRLIKYAQRDASFRGFEAEFSYAFSPDYSVSVFGDRVRAQFDDGTDLPRIPPSRVGVRFNAAWGDFDGEVEYYSASRQTRFADYETATPGYDMLNASLGYRFGDYRSSSVFMRVSNLLNQQVWNHSSFLADVIPLPGRNLSIGYSYQF